MQQRENGGSLETQVQKDDAPAGSISFTAFIELLNVGVFFLYFNCHGNFNITMF
jgi:hypothetical protein